MFMGRFTTWTLRYNRAGYIRIDGLQEHWEKGTVEIEPSGEGLRVQTGNVSAFSLVVALLKP